MRINIRTKNIELDEALKAWVYKKIGELDRLLFNLEKSKDFIGGRAEIEIQVEIGKTTRGQLKGDIFRAEAQLYLPKGNLRAESTQEDLRTAINEIKDELQREIRKYKEKKIVQTRRGSRIAKKRFRSPEAARRRQEKIRRLMKILRIRRKK
jgi:putative sigma-54 modulation protein